MLRVGYIGNFMPFHSTENHVRKSLEEMGHMVMPIQEDIYTADRVYQLVKDSGCDLLLYTRTWGMAGLQAVLDRLQAEGVPSASYHLDLYYGLERTGLYRDLKSKGIDGIHNDPFWHTTYVFTVDGNPKSAEWFKQNNINHFYVRAGVYGKEAYIAAESAANGKRDFENDIVFVGSYGYHPEWPYRHQLIDWLRNTYGPRFRLVPTPGQPAIRNEALNQLYADTKIVVGDTLCPGFTHDEYWSDRVYETTGRGGFIIHPMIKGLETQFVDKKEAVFYKYQDFEQLKALIDYYLEHDEEREAIRRAGHERTKREHTYVHRMTQILSKIAEFEPQIAAKLK